MNYTYTHNRQLQSQQSKFYVDVVEGGGLHLVVEKSLSLLCVPQEQLVGV